MLEKHIRENLPFRSLSSQPVTIKEKMTEGVKEERVGTDAVAQTHLTAAPCSVLFVFVCIYLHTTHEMHYKGRLLVPTFHLT